MSQIFIVDDNAFLRKMIKKFIEMEPGFHVCGEAETKDEVFRALPSVNVDVMLVDISLSGNEEGIELIKEIRAKGYQFPILTVSLHEEALYANRVLEAGAQGYLMKQDASTHMVKAIQYVLQNAENFFSASSIV